MSVLDSDIMSHGHCLAGERFNFIIDDMAVGHYQYVKALKGLKRGPNTVRKMFWQRPDSIDIIKKNIEDYPIKDQPINTMLHYIEYQIMKQINMTAGKTRRDDNSQAVFASLLVGGHYVRMLTIKIEEK